MTIIKDIPILIPQSQEEIESVKEPYAYLIGKDGFYIKKENKFFKSLAKIESIPGMTEIKEYCSLNEIEKVPYELIQKTIVFFRKIYDKYKSEAVVLLLHDENGWSLHVPTQKVASTSLSYDVASENFNGKILAGSIHSHADFSAFHSGGDSADEAGFDGIHVTIGNVNSSCSISCSIVVNGFRQMVDAKDIITEMPEIVIDDSWVTKVGEDKPISTPILTPQQDELGYGGYGNYKNGSVPDEVKREESYWQQYKKEFEKRTKKKNKKKKNSVWELE